MEQFPKILEAKAKEYEKTEWRIVYMGQHPDKPDCAVYGTDLTEKALAEEGPKLLGFPTVWFVYDNKYEEIQGMDALHIVQKMRADK